MDCLQNWHIGPNLWHTLTKSGTITMSESVMSLLVIEKSKVLGLFVFVGIYLALIDQQALILPEALFLGFNCVVWVTG